MPRIARKKSESGIYHIMLRGINRQSIFEDDEDCEKYLQCLFECKSVSGFTPYAYCLMGNHLHLLLAEGKESLEQIFKRIGARYVFWYNWKYKRSGHLFQDRLKSETVNDDAYFLAVLRYVYQNPVKAGLCKQAGDYAWSSYRTLSEPTPPVEHRRALELLPLEQFKAFVDAPSEDQFLDLEPDTRVTDREATELVKKVCGVLHLSEIQTLPAERQADYLKTLHGQNCSIRQLARLTGVSKGQIERILKG